MSYPLYKSVTVEQLRSFVETVRGGSLTAAAASLGLAQPTVGKLVHALEKHLGVALLRPHSRGCEQTEEGRILFRLCSPCITNLDLLPTRFQEATAAQEVLITVAGSPRLLGEDLVPCVADFVKRWPSTRFIFREVQVDEVSDLVAAGQADLGFTPLCQVPRERSPLTFQPCYYLDVLLVTPHDHPLTRRRRVRPEDLKPFPLITRNLFQELPSSNVITDLGLDETQPRWLEARQASIIRRGVEEGLGIALLLGLSGRMHSPKLHERVMTPHFGRAIVYLIQKAGVTHHHPTVAEFAETVHTLLTAPQPRIPARKRR